MSKISYIALYRKWRPDNFSEVVGQNHITQILNNQILNDQIGHAYLFCGTRGTGKTSIAKIFAKAVNCISSDNVKPCNECEICKGIQNETILDVIEMDAASNNGVDDIRELKENVQYPPTKGKYKVYIIDEVHMLSTGAFNALLKTLEEPPSYVIFILATTEPHKLPATILSRCQRFDFKRIKEQDIVNRMRFICDEMNIKIDDKALYLIARNSDGAVRDALSILDQCVSYGLEYISYNDVVEIIGATSDEYMFKLVDYLVQKDTSKVIALIEEMVVEGRDIQQFVRELIVHFRNLLMTKVVKDSEIIIQLSEENIKRIKEQSQNLDINYIIRGINIFSKTSADMKWSTQPRILLEVAIIKITNPEIDNSIEGLLERISNIEKIIKNGDKINNSNNNTEIIKKEVVEIKKSDNIEKNKPEDFVDDKSNDKNVNVKENMKDEITQINKLWIEICAKAKQKKPSISAFIKDTQICGIRDNAFTVVFKNNNIIFKEYIERKENKECIEEEFYNLTNKKYLMKCIIEKELGDEEGNAAKEESQIKEIYEMFGESNVDIVE